MQTRHQLRWLAFIAAAVVLGPAPVHGRRAQPPTFRSGIELVSLNVSVVDKERQFIAGLGPEDFSVYENGVPREVAFFGADAVPIDAGLMLDVSGSMADKMAFIAKAGVGFIRTLRPGDRVAVMGFADRVSVLQGLTSDVAQLERAIKQARPVGMTALYDALYVAAREFAQTPITREDIRRRALIVLSDGADTTSLMDRETALAAVHRAGVTVYTIAPYSRMTPRYRFPSLRAKIEAESFLTTLAADTGGRAFFLDALHKLPGVYREIASEIFQQYTLAYEAKDEPGWGAKFRQLLVRVVPRADAIVRTRRGYDPRESKR